MRVVLDTNTIISGLFWDGLPWQVYHAALTGEYVLLASDAMIKELDDVLHRQKFAAALTEIDKTPELVVASHREVVELVHPADIAPDTVRDPKDTMILACAIGGKADYIVSGDKDLLALDIYQRIPIFSAVQFLEKLFQ